MLHLTYMNMRLELPKNPFESDVAGSKTELFTNKFKTWLLNNVENIDSTKLSTEEGLKEIIANSRVLRMGVTVEEVFAELQQQGFIKEQVEEVVESAKSQEEIVSFRPERLKIIEDKEVLDKLEDNKFFEELETDSYFEPQELERIYKRSLETSMGTHAETLESYLEFADKGLLKGGHEKAKEDFEYVQKMTQLFEEEEKEALVVGELGRTAKIATITEAAIAYGVSKLNWYGDKVIIHPVLKFNDIANGVDEVMQIKDGNNEGVLLGLGIDVTFRGMLHKIYKEKFDKLLRIIAQGKSTEIKYFKNSEGEMFSEFSIPKIVLHINFKEMRDLVAMMGNVDDTDVIERFKKSPQRISVVRQVVIMCKALGDFAKKHNNPIFEKYYQFESFMRSLVETDPQLKPALENEEKSDIYVHTNYLIQSFKVKP